MYNIHMATWSSSEIIKILKADGWYEVAKKGSHVQFKHATKRGRVTVQHPMKDIPAGTVGSIRRQAGIEFKK